jgi:hypothetical protein
MFHYHEVSDHNFILADPDWLLFLKTINFNNVWLASKELAYSKLFFGALFSFRVCIKFEDFETDQSLVSSITAVIILNKIRILMRIRHVLPGLENFSVKPLANLLYCLERHKLI